MRRSERERRTREKGQKRDKWETEQQEQAAAAVPARAPSIGRVSYTGQTPNGRDPIVSGHIRGHSQGGVSGERRHLVSSAAAAHMDLPVRTT